MTEPVVLDWTLLNQAVVKGDEINAKLAKFKNEGLAKSNFTAKLKVAKAVQAKADDATQSEINDAAKALASTELKLRLTPDPEADLLK